MTDGSRELAHKQAAATMWLVTRSRLISLSLAAEIKGWLFREGALDRAIELVDRPPKGCGSLKALQRAGIRVLFRGAIPPSKARETLTRRSRL